MFGEAGIRTKLDPTKLTLLRDLVLVEVDPAAASTKSRIIVPEKYRIPPLTGTVRNVGRGVLLDDGETLLVPSVNNGDRVMFSDGAHQEIHHGEQKFLLVRETEILAVREEDDNGND